MTGPPSVMDAIYGSGDDVWSGPAWFADPLTSEQARAYAAERGIDLFAEHCEDPGPEQDPSLRVRLFARARDLLRRATGSGE